MSPFVIAVLLAAIAGYVDAVGYLDLSNVFTAHMSGNTVASAAHFGTGEWFEISRRVFPIPMFVLGVFCGALIGKAVRRKGFRSRFAPSFALEAVLILIFIALTYRSKFPQAPFGGTQFLLVALLAVAMGLQNATLRHARKLSIRITFVSGMLVNMAEKMAGYVASLFETSSELGGGSSAVRRRRREGTQAIEYGLLWCGMLFGAVCGSAVVTVWGTIGLLAPVAGLLGVTIQDLIRPIPER